jgi:DnaK suppressor protein
MSELTRDQKQMFQERLANRHKELRAEIREELERYGLQHFQDMAGEVSDLGDASVADMLVDFDIGMVKRQIEELTLVEQAQKRLNATDFNVCQECGEDIDFSRLMANPVATRCIVCQVQREKFYQHDDMPKL